MFETRQAIRDAALQSRIETAVKQALEKERQRIREGLAKSDLPAHVQQQVLEKLQSES